MLIRLAGMRGWQLERSRPFAGALCFYQLRRGDDIVGPRPGRQLADVATDLFLDAMRRDDSPNLRRSPSDRDPARDE